MSTKGDSSTLIEGAIAGYRLARILYEQQMYADTCLNSYNVAYNLLKAYGLKAGLGVDVVSPEGSLLALAIELNISDPEVLQELSRLSFVHLYFTYPELHLRSEVRFHEGVARRCLRSVEIIAYKLHGLSLQRLL